MERRWLTEPEIDRAITFRQIGRRMKERRTDLGLSQEAVGRRCGMSRQTIQNAEKGETESDVITIYRIAEALETTVFELMPERPEWTEPEPTAARGSRFSYPLPPDDLPEREIPSLDQRRYAREEQPEGLATYPIGLAQ